MTVQLREDGAIVLAGVCDSADAEVLLSQLLANPQAAVDWRACDMAHTAVVQVLVAAGIAPVGAPGSRYLMDVVEPLLTGG